MPFEFESAGSQIIFYEPGVDYERGGARPRHAAAAAFKELSRACSRRRRHEPRLAHLRRRRRHALGAALIDAAARAGFDEPRRRAAGRAGPDRRRRRSRSSSRTARPEYVFVAAGKSGGIGAEPRAAGRADARQPAGRGARPRRGAPARRARSCSTSPARAPTRATRRSRCASSRCWTGPLEPTSEAYATAKLAGLAAVRRLPPAVRVRLRHRFPANAFGPHDDFGAEQRPRHPGADPPGARGEAARRCRADRLGQRHAAARVRLFAATWPTPACS